MFTANEVFECVFWAIGHLMFPCALIYGMWFALHRVPNRTAGFVMDCARCVLFVLVAPFRGVLHGHSDACFLAATLAGTSPAAANGLRTGPRRPADGKQSKRTRTSLVQKYARNRLSMVLQTIASNDISSRCRDRLIALKPKIRLIFEHEEDGMCSVRIGIFGGHSTGGRGQDFYIIKVVCPYPTNTPRQFRVNEDAKVRYGNRKIADGIFEITHPS